jgi:hypothetical protein
MSFTYLGLPVGTTRPQVQEFMPMLNRIERRIMGINSMLTYAGSLIMVNSVLSALPTFYMYTFKIPISILEQIDKYRKHFLWDKGDINRRGGCLVAWKKACLAKDQGGLGIIDLRDQNSAPLLKYLHKFYNKMDLPWVNLTWRCMYSRPIVPHARKLVGSFWWRDVMNLVDSFRQLATCKVNIGDTAMFWHGQWDLGILRLQFPQLHSFSQKGNISVQKFLMQTDFQNFHTPIFIIASNQLLSLARLVSTINVDANTPDQWSYIWNSPMFTVKKAYKALKGTMPVSPVFKWMWASNVGGKYKFFFWLLLRDRLNTRNLLRRKNKNLDEYVCVLCQQGVEETLEHLFFCCPFSLRCWTFIGFFWDISLPLSEMVVHARTAFGLAIFREIAILAAWCIWTHRNSIIFDGGSLSFRRWRQALEDELSFLLHRAKPSLKAEIELWMSNRF